MEHPVNTEAYRRRDNVSSAYDALKSVCGRAQSMIQGNIEEVIG